MRTVLWWGNPQGSTPPPPVFATLNPADLSANISLLNGNLTAKCADTNYGGVRSTTSHDSGKFYLEFQNGSGLNANQDAIGFADSSAVLTSGLGPDIKSSICAVGTSPNAPTYFNNVNMGTPGNGANGGSVINCCVIDLTANLIWFRVANGNWNNSGSADPATGTGGFSIAGRTSNWFAIVQLKWTNDNITVNFGASAFTYTPPSGFVHW